MVGPRSERLGSLPYLRTRLQQEHAEVRQCDSAFVSFRSANLLFFPLTIECKDETIFLHKNEQLQKDKYIAIKPAIIHHSTISAKKILE